MKRRTFFKTMGMLGGLAFFDVGKALATVGRLGMARVRGSWAFLYGGYYKLPIIERLKLRHPKDFGKSGQEGIILPSYKERKQ